MLTQSQEAMLPGKIIVLSEGMLCVNLGAIQALSQESTLSLVCYNVHSFDSH